MVFVLRITAAHVVIGNRYLTLNFKIMAELNLSTGKSAGKRSIKRMPVGVDLTAMVDLAFLLITFFMLTTALAKPRIMQVVMPVGPPGVVPESRTMTLCLGEHNQLLWYLGMADKPLTIPKQISYGRDLRMAIIETGKQVFKSTGKSMIVVIKPSIYSVYANLVETLDELNITNVPTYAIADILTKDIDLLKQKGIY